MLLRAAGIGTLAAARAADPEALVAAGVDTPTLVESTRDLAGARAQPEQATPTMALKRLRTDHPKVKPTTGGRLELALAAAASPESRAEALEELREDMYANSSQASRDSVWITWRAIAQAWRVPPIPLTAEVVTSVCASLKKGGHRSAQQYVSRARLEHVRTLRRSPSPAAKLAIRDCLRSARRGIGPSALKDAPAFEKIGETAAYAQLGVIPQP